MARRPLSERLATERERIARLQDKVRKLEAQERRTERSRDTRRKVLLGALVMDELERGSAMSGELRWWLAERLPDYLQRDNDREVMARFMDGEPPAGLERDLTDERSDNAPTPPATYPGGHDDDR